MKLIQDFRDTMNPPVFFGSAGFIISFVFYGTVYSDDAESLFSVVQDSLIASFGWFYVLAASTMLCFVIWLGLSRFGNIRLGGDDSKPEFGRLTWFTMLMAAGMGIGLVFYGVTEPVLHYISPPPCDPAERCCNPRSHFLQLFSLGITSLGDLYLHGFAIGLFSFSIQPPTGTTHAALPPDRRSDSWVDRSSGRYHCNRRDAIRRWNITWPWSDAN